jgi:hypothetical protein
MKYINIIFFSLLILSACETETPNSNSNNQNPKVETDTTKPQTPNVETNTTKKESSWFCIPNKQVGLIKADADEESIIAAYGKENVIREEVGIGEGEMVAATVVFPNTPNELIVEWQSELEYTKLSRIRIEQENAKWETEEGIKTGTTLEELLEINGKDFNFYGFDWDYGGITNEWEGGNINPQLTVFLEPKNPEGASEELSGDGVFSSSHPKAKEAELEVVAFIIYFGL